MNVSNLKRLPINEMRRVIETVDCHEHSVSALHVIRKRVAQALLVWTLVGTIEQHIQVRAMKRHMAPRWAANGGQMFGKNVDGVQRSSPLLLK